MYQKILVPLDGSKVAEAILPCVVWLARGFGTGVTLLMVTRSREEIRQPSFRQSGPTGVETMERLALDPNRYLEGVAQYLTVRRIVAEPVVVAGDAPQEILSQGRERGCDLIAMSTRGRSGLGRGLLGSVTDAVVRSSKIPVVVVGPRSSPQEQKEGMSLRGWWCPWMGPAWLRQCCPT